MKRRDYCIAVGSTIWFAGCPQSKADSGNVASIESVSGDEITDPEGVALAVEHIKKATVSQPARIEISLTNRATDTRRFTFGATPPFTPTTGKNEGATATLMLVPDDRSGLSPREDAENGDPFVPDTPTDGCWRAKTQMGVTDVVNTRKLAPEEAVREQYTLIATPKTYEDAPCMPADDYRFVQQDYLGTGQPWGFTVRIEQ